MLDTFQTCARQAYERFVAKTIPWVDTPELLAGKQDHKSLERRLQHDVPLPAHLEQCEGPVRAVLSRGTPLVEYKIAVDRNLAPTGFFDHDVYIRGVLDVLLLTKNWQTGFVVDWKTGKNREGQYGKEPLQLMLSAAYVFAGHDNCESVTALNIYTGAAQMGTAHTWQRSELPELWRHVMPIIHEMEGCESAGKWPETPGPLCGWCPVLACSHNRSKERV